MGGGIPSEEDVAFLRDNMPNLLGAIIGDTPLGKCTSIGAGSGIYPKLPDSVQCVRVPVGQYVFMVYRQEEAFAFMAYCKMPLKNSTDFLLKDSRMDAVFGGTKCRSLNAALKRDVDEMDEEYADGSVFVTPPVVDKLAPCKMFKPYRDGVGMHDGVLISGVGGMGEHGVYRVTGALCDDPDYRVPEIYWLSPMFGVACKAEVDSGSGKKEKNPLYAMLDDMFFEVFVLESVEWVHVLDKSDGSSADEESDVAVATEQDGEAGMDSVEGDRIRIVLGNGEDVGEQPGKIILTRDQVAGIDPMLYRAVSELPIGRWMQVDRDARPEFLKSMDAMVAASTNDGEVVSISSMFTGDETIYVLSELEVAGKPGSVSLEKRRCAVFHEADYANWSLCRTRMRRVACLGEILSTKEQPGGRT